MFLVVTAAAVNSMINVTSTVCVHVCVQVSMCSGTPAHTSLEKQWSVTMGGISAMDPLWKEDSTMTCGLKSKREGERKSVCVCLHVCKDAVV